MYSITFVSLDVFSTPQRSALGYLLVFRITTAITVYCYSLRHRDLWTRKKTNHSKSLNRYPIIPSRKSRPSGSQKPEKKHLLKPTPTSQTREILSRKPISRTYTNSCTEKNSSGTQCLQKPTTGTQSGLKYPTLPITQDLRIGNFKLTDKNHLLSSK